jgi:hypothetical protein
LCVIRDACRLTTVVNSTDHIGKPLCLLVSCWTTDQIYHRAQFHGCYGLYHRSYTSIWLYTVHSSYMVWYGIYFVHASSTWHRTLSYIIHTGELHPYFLKPNIYNIQQFHPMCYIHCNRPFRVRGQERAISIVRGSLNPCDLWCVSDFSPT